MLQSCRVSSWDLLCAQTVLPSQRATSAICLASVQGQGPQSATSWRCRLILGRMRNAKLFACSCWGRRPVHCQSLASKGLLEWKSAEGGLLPSAVQCCLAYPAQPSLLIRWESEKAQWTAYSHMNGPFQWREKFPSLDWISWHLYKQDTCHRDRRTSMTWPYWSTA